MSYAKLFSHIVTSSIWTEDDQTRICWITMLALANQHGEVMASIPGLARVAGIPLDSTEKAIAKLSSPDAYSRTKEEEGRRIEEIDGGWSIINYAKHRRMASLDEKREKARARQAKKRARECHAPVTPCHASSQNVTLAHDKAEAEADTEANTEVGKSEASEPNTGIDEPTAANFGDNQDEWIGRLSHIYPDRDVDGELRSFIEFCRKKGTSANQRGFEGWIQKASPSVKLAERKVVARL